MCFYCYCFVIFCFFFVFKKKVVWMNSLLKLHSNTSSLFEGFKLVQAVAAFSTNSIVSGLLTSNTNANKISPLLYLTATRSAYTFNSLNPSKVRYRRVTRPRKSSIESILLNYEQAQFAEKIGVTKSWNSWNTCKQ